MDTPSTPSKSNVLEAEETNVLRSIEDAYADLVCAIEMSEDETDELLGGGSSVLCSHPPCCNAQSALPLESRVALNVAADYSILRVRREC